MENINHKKWYDNIIWIFFISFLIIYVSETIGSFFIPKINYTDFSYTLVSYLIFIEMWLGVLFAVIIFKNNHYILGKISVKAKGNNIKNLIIGFILGFVLNSLCAIIALGNGDFTLHFSKFELFPAIALLFAVFIQSSAEEVLCRGFMYQRLLKSTNSPVYTIIFNSLFFGVLHLFNSGMTFLPFYCIFIFGVLTSMIVYYFDSLWMAMSLHAMWNFTQSILFGLPNSGLRFPYSIFNMGEHIKGSFAYDTVFGLEGTILSCALITICCVALYLWKSKKNKEEVVLN